MDLQSAITVSIAAAATGVPVLLWVGRLQSSFTTLTEMVKEHSGVLKEHGGELERVAAHGDKLEQQGKRIDELTGSVAQMIVKQAVSERETASVVAGLQTVRSDIASDRETMKSVQITQAEIRGMVSEIRDIALRSERVTRSILNAALQGRIHLPDSDTDTPPEGVPRTPRD